MRPQRQGDARAGRFTRSVLSQQNNSPRLLQITNGNVIGTKY